MPRSDESRSSWSGIVTCGHHWLRVATNGTYHPHGIHLVEQISIDHDRKRCNLDGDPMTRSMVGMGSAVIFNLDGPLERQFPRVEWCPRTKFWLSPYDANLRNSMHGHRQFKKSRPCYTFFESRRNIVTPQYISLRAKNIPNVKKTITQLLFLADCQNARHLSGSSFDFTKVYQLFATKCFGIVTDKNILIFSDRRGESL